MRLVSLCAALLLAAVVSAEVTVPYKPGMRLHPISNIPPQNYSSLNGATVSIEEGYSEGDQLLLDYAGEFDISANFDQRTGSLYISGTATTSEYARAIQDVVFITSSELGGARRVTWSFGANTLYNTRTQHFYQFNPETGVVWGNANTNCPLKPLLGMQGYLATVTSQPEMDMLSRKAMHSAWIGGQAKTSPTWEWMWSGGPEQGTVFWNGPNMYRGGSAPANAYTKWGRFQPTGRVAQRYLSLQPSEDAYAAWYSTADTEGVQGYVCEYGGMDSTEVAAAAQHYAGTVLLEFGCSEFKTKGDCDNQAALGCSFKSGTCQQTSCAAHVTQHLCQEKPQCQWSTSGKIGLCVDTPCANLDTATCQASSKCYTPAGSTTCVPRTCATQDAGCTCSGLDDSCLWRENKCFNEASLNCNGMDTVYLIDGGTTMGQRFGLYSSGFVGLTSLLRSSEQFLTGTGSGTTSSGGGQRVGYFVYGSADYDGAPRGQGTSQGEITGILSQKNADLIDLENKFPSSSMRYLESAITAAHGMLNGSNFMTTNRKPNIVIFASGAIADRALAAKAVGDAVMMGIKVFGVALRSTPPGDHDSKAAEQDLGVVLGGRQHTAMVSLTMSQVQSHAIFGMCSNTTTLGAVALKDASIAQTCSMRSFDDCAASELCSWSYSAGRCARSQCARLCSSSCALDATCTWTASGTCAKKCFGTSACAIGCTRVNGICSAPKCNANPTEDACIADPEKCVYNSTATTPCQAVMCPTYTTESACGDHADMCSYINSQCVHDPCKTRVEHNCQQLAQCKWGKATIGATTDTCFIEPTCGTRQNEQACATSTMCMWDTTVGPAACVLAPCTGINANTNRTETRPLCMGNSNCQWKESDNGICAVKTCAAHITSCACSADDSCVWRNSTCKDARYSQCPMIDVFFLVEGTLAMRQDFGRHPSGFMGVMEAVRAWSKDAPWAKDEGATGYRMGMALFGAPTARTVPPVVPGQPLSPAGNGKYFINDANRFEGVDGVIDFFEGQIPQYSSNAAGSNFLRPGLEAAEIMFNTSGASRKRVLVILGASPFTDGANVNSPIGPVVERLESLGVSIFSNIIRRFNSITPIELQSEMFMRPLASDPASTHFLFTTIENLRPMLLDKFCDPSTSTGMSLGVSRDNTLPCNWLAEGECALQRNCMWDGSAMKTCPLPTQCPNLECQELPEALQGAFTCPQCTMSSGVISCSKTSNVTDVGLCKPNSCATSQCTSESCNGASGCTWDSNTARCNKDVCTSLSGVDACNGNLGCYWDGSACQQSMAWRKRSAASCAAPMATYTEGSDSATLPANFWLTTVVPAVCVNHRCPYLTTTQCQGSQGTAEGCKFNSGGVPRCSRKVCPYTSSIQCRADANCYWNPFDSLQGTCIAVPSDGSCKVSKFSNWTQCTATCGNGIEYRSRRVLSVRDPTKDEAAKTCEQDAGGPLVQSKACAIPSSSSNCSTHCSTYTTNNDRIGCARDISCRWKDGCEPIALRSCAEMSETACNASSFACMWDNTIKFCVPALRQCTSYSTEGACTSVAGSGSCAWHSGATANDMAAELGVTAQLVNPGPQQKPIFAFPDIEVSSTEVIDGATVAIEKNYQRNKDKLSLLYPSTFTATWSPAAGTLTLAGQGTVGDYVNAIRFVTFETTSAAPNPRVVSWSLKRNTVYSGTTGKVFQYFASSGITWDAAVAACAATSYWGRQGYLAVLNNADDNAVVASKLWAEGWIGASDASPAKWLWTTGPFTVRTSQFWEGPAAVAGGLATSGSYANWNNVEYQPSTFEVQGVNHAYLGLSGTWEAHNGQWSSAKGYVCEYGGLGSDSAPPFTTGGSAVIGVGGCSPTPCVWRNASVCTLDAECAIATRCSGTDENGACNQTQQICVQACSSQSTPQSCEADKRCKWDTTVVPAACSWNPCDLAKDQCMSAAQCTWDPLLKCRFKTGCAAITESASCNTAPACIWVAGDSVCVKKQCSNIDNAAVCGENPTCSWNEDTQICADATCRAGSEPTCTADPRCQWVEKSSGAVMGFAVGGNPIMPFASASPPGSAQGATLIDGVTIMITEGLRANNDILDVSDTFIASKGWTKTFDKTTGTLTIWTGGASTAQTVFNMVQSQVTFSTNSKSDGMRTIEYTLGGNMYRSVSGRYVKYVGGLETSLSFSEAESKCNDMSYLGMSGTLAAVPTEQDALNLGKFKPSGWIGAWSTSNNQWFWRASGNKFWQVGMGQFGPVKNSNGTDIFAYWAAGQPAEVPPAQTYWAAVTPVGTWKSATSKSSVKGYVCSFAAPVAVAHMAKQVRAEGCFPRACLSLTRAQCALRSSCRWFANEQRCAADGFCADQTSASGCNRRAGCYWNYATALCSTAAPDVCTDLNQTRCSNKADFPTCNWVGSLTTRSGFGACVKTDCVGLDVAECQNRPQCYVSNRQCLGRICGFITRDNCFKDTQCTWQASTCQVSKCAKYTTTADCTGDSDCQMSSTGNTCERKQCPGSVTDPIRCQANPGCIFTGGVCRAPGCAGLAREACMQSDDCFYMQDSVSGDSCVTRRCNGNLANRSQCEGEANGGAPCIWKNNKCEMNAARNAPEVISDCEKEIEPDLWWLWALCVVILILIVAIIYRLYLAYSKGMNFFEPTKNTKSFSPHVNYKDMAYEEAQQTDVDANAAYQAPRPEGDKPSINDL